MTLYAPPNVTHPGPAAATITMQQARVLDGLILGLTSTEIAGHLHLSPYTVKTHTKRLYAALGARGRAHAVALVLTGRVTVTIGGHRS